MHEQSDYYHNLTTEDLLKRVSENPPDTPDWIKSNAELTRRAEERRGSRASSVPREREIIDPLSEVTRRERRLLLIVDVVLLAIVLGNLVPTQVQALGISVSKAERGSLLLLLMSVDLYLLVAFWIYGRADLTAHAEDTRIFIRERARAILTHASTSESVLNEGTSSDSCASLARKQRSCTWSNGLLLAEYIELGRVSISGCR